jgi:lipoprotein-anchoring transpeptidase ErfK/SrfK
MTPCTRLLRRSPAILVGLVALVALLPTGASGAGKLDAIAWHAPTPAEGKHFKVSAGSRLTFLLHAAVPGNALPVEIGAAVPLPAGASLAPRNGSLETVRFTWMPKVAQAGTHRVTFGANAPGLVSAARSVVIQVLAAQKTVLSDTSAESYKWAFVTRRTVVRSGPTARSRVVAPLLRNTPEYFPNLVQTLNSIRFPNGETWVQVRLAIRPNSSTGWVRRGALGRYRTVRTRLVVDRSRLRATLFRAGRPVFRTIVGVGQSHWPTPRGEFYIREILTGYNMPAYGPIAFGLSARSNVLTDWPGGGFIGIHGTNAPGILPGRVSHGCIRMRNGAVLRLRRLMPLGTPVQVR